MVYRTPELGPGERAGRDRAAAAGTALRGWDEPLSQQTASADLRAMVAAGLLQQRGRNRGAYYESAEPLREIRTAAQRERTPIDTSGLFIRAG